MVISGYQIVTVLNFHLLFQLQGVSPCLLLRVIQSKEIPLVPDLLPYELQNRGIHSTEKLYMIKLVKKST